LSLKLVKRDGSDHWYLRGTVRGRSVFERLREQTTKKRQNKSALSAKRNSWKKAFMGELLLLRSQKQRVGSTTHSSLKNRSDFELALRIPIVRSSVSCAASQRTKHLIALGTERISPRRA
jgi:hypothetical protein